MKRLLATAALLAMAAPAGCTGGGEGGDDAGDTGADGVADGDADAGIDAWGDCPAPGAFHLVYYVNQPWEFTEPVVATVLDVSLDPDGRLAFTVEYTDGGLTAERTFHVSIPDGADVDLHAGDVVSVEYAMPGACFLPQTGRLGVTDEVGVVIEAMSCCHVSCYLTTFEIGPLVLNEIRGRCEPEADELECSMWESTGLVVACVGASGTEEFELFEGETATLSCGDGWHVGHGGSARAVEQLQICTDYQQLSRGYIAVRHGDGIAEGP